MKRSQGLFIRIENGRYARPYGLLYGVKGIRDQGYFILRVLLLLLREIISPLTPEFCFFGYSLGRTRGYRS